MNESTPGRRLLPTILSCALAAGLAATAAVVWRQGRRIDDLTAAARTNDATLQQILAEVNRVRLEQRSEVLGTQGLLKKLQTYAPMLTSARVPEPDYLAAKAEMDAILRALATIGEDAWKPITERLRELKSDTNFDEVKWLLRAAVKVDPKAGKEIVKDVLAGTRLPSPRLRLEAARMMTEIDKPLAQTMLRHILMTESSRGVNMERAMAQGAPIPDAAALSASGFHNFVAQYTETDDPQIDDTLLMVVGRAEHDLATVQKCVELLGRRKCERATATIEKLYRNPPHNQENPLFLNHCLTALHQIKGAAARPFLEEALKNATTETVANHCTFLLGSG